MSLDLMLESFPWARYSRKLKDKILNPHSVGLFTAESAEKRGMRYAEGVEGHLDDGNIAVLFFLVDKSDGAVVDAKFQAIGQSALIGACEAICDLSIGKNYDQAKRLSSDYIEKQMQGKSSTPAFPFETYPHLNLALSALEKAMDQCVDLPLPESYVTPFSSDVIALEGGYPGWEELPLKKKLAVIEQVICEDVRPFIELDAGGIEVLNLLNDREVIIAYQGTCTNCFSATGATLSYIQQILQAKVHKNLIVTPDLDTLNF